MPSASQAAKMKEMLERFNEAATWLAQLAFERKSANKFYLQKNYYTEMRQRFTLPSQYAIRCIAQVCEAYKRDKSIKPKFRKYASIPLDHHLMNFKGIDRVSLKTLTERVLVPFVMGAYQRERFGFAKGQADLVLRKDGKWFLLVTVDLPEKAPVPVTDFIGVDMGTVMIATDSDGQHFDGANVEANRLHYLKKKRQLQRKAAHQINSGKRPKNIRRKLKKLSGRERRFKKDTNHVISRRLVDKAKDTNRGIALEDLKGIGSRIQFRKAQRDSISKWAFAELRAMIEYKSAMADVPVVAINPAYTSQACSACGHIERASRRSRGIFWCKRCGHFDHADINAAKNISSRAVVIQPIVAEPLRLTRGLLQRQATAFPASSL